MIAGDPHEKEEPPACGISWLAAIVGGSVAIAASAVSGTP
jgi:hypothetical protein